MSSTANTPVEFTLSHETNVKGALFNIDRPVANGPTMSGSIEVDGVKVPVSGFVKTADSGVRYMALSLGSENGVHYYGKLFRQEKKRHASSPDYTGFITLLRCETAGQYSDDEWDEAEQLQVCGRRVRSTDGTARIALTVSSRQVREGETAF